MARTTELQTEVFDEIRLRITRKDLAESLSRHEMLLTTKIRDAQGTDAGSGILTLIDTIKALRSQIIPMDDPAGRGLSSDVED